MDSPSGLDAFRTWTSFFVNYKLPLEYDLANRFRTGEMPIAITDYSFYNLISVFAPEIRGMWSFVPVPGIEQEDGSIRRDVPGSGTCCIILSQSDKKDKAWEFLKWWTSTEIQTNYGRNLESILGAAARYSTANVNAMRSLPWRVRDYKNLEAQWEYVCGVPEVPGGYFTSRHIDNAFRKVINENANPRETLIDYVKVINEEIKYKRVEFGLD